MNVLGFTITLLLILASLVHADQSSDRKKAQRMIKELKDLQRAGVALHKNYNLRNANEHRACVAENRKYRDQGKNLMTEARDTTIPMQYRQNLIFASDAAFECVFCSDNSLKACSSIQSEITALEKKLRAD